MPQHELDPARLLTLVERRVVGRLARATEEAGHTVEEWRVLSLLADDSGHPMSEIADYTMLPPPTLTKVVDRMVSANLVYRRPDEIDRRRILVFMSARGRTSHERLTTAITQAWQDLGATAGKEELALLNALLARLADRLT